MSERSEVQVPLIHYATEFGWMFIPRDGALTDTAAERKRAGLEELFRAMLRELMTGRVRVNGLIESPK